MSKRVIPDEAKLLKRAQDLIKDEKNWCRGVSIRTSIFFKGGDDYEVVPQYCAMGALHGVKELKNLTPVLHCTLNDAARELYQTSIVCVNDQIGHAAVMKCYDRAIENLIISANSS
jgi:hypothetical protein